MIHAFVLSLTCYYMCENKLNMNYNTQISNALHVYIIAINRVHGYVPQIATYLI